MALTDKLTAIANSIRAMSGKSAALTLAEMPTEIEDLKDTEDILVRGTATSYKNDRITSVGQYRLSYLTSCLSIDLPNVTSTSTYAFYYNTKMVEINVPKLRTIANSAFRNLYVIKKLDFPAATSIAARAFQTSYSLQAIVLRSTSLVSLANVDAFDNCYHYYGTKNTSYNPDGLKDGYFYVPRNLISTYEAATNWSALAGQFRAIEDYTVDGTITGALNLSVMGVSE